MIFNCLSPKLAQHGIKSFLSLIFFLLLTSLLLTGCFGSGGSAGTPTTPVTKVTLSGTAFDAAIVGGTVTVLDSNGSVLGTATTDSNGQFSLDVPEDKLSGGYRLSIGGGTMDGVAFTGTLTATYAAKDAKNTVNLTPITTLLDRLAEGQAGGTFLEKRDAAIQQLVGLGMVKADDWFALTSDRFDLNTLAARIGAKGGLQAWLDALVADLADGELSIEEMAVFPKTNGGIVSVGLQGATDGVFSVFIGDALQSKISVAGQEGASYQYQAVTAPNGLTVSADGAIAYTVPDGTTEKQNIPLTFKVTNTATGLGRTVSGGIYPMKRNVSGGATVNPVTGTKEITTAAGDTSVKIFTDGMTTPGKVEIIQSLNAEGNPQTTYSFDKNVIGEIEVTLPDPEAPNADVFQSSVQTKAVARPQVAGRSAAVESQTTYPNLSKWLDNTAHFWKTNETFGLGNRVRDKVVRYTKKDESEFKVISTEQRSFALSSDCQITDKACFVGKVPVLFVHGYSPNSPLFSDNGLGGGTGTWDYFPQAIEEKITNAQTFEFQWNTAAHFEDVAGDLAKAIKLIAEETGQKVHIVAHSFGGVLTRTYLQGLATGMPYNDDVASVTTVGSPHSGIFNPARKAHGIDFSQGQDSQSGGKGTLTGEAQISLCGQISCYQMGQKVGFDKIELDIHELDEPNFESLSENPGRFIATLQNFSSHPLPSGLPIQVLIGLSTSRTNSDGKTVDEGDGLISFAGQRISASFASAIAYRNKSSEFGGIVTEKLLGLNNAVPSDLYPGRAVDTSLIKHARYGYRHSGKVDPWFSTNAGAVPPANAVPEVQVSESCNEADVACADTDNHAAFIQARNWIEAVGNQPYTDRPSGKLTLKPFVDIFPTGQIAILALNPATTGSLATEQRTYLESLVAKANNSKIVRGGLAHWDTLGKVEADTIKNESQRLFGNNAASDLVSKEMQAWSINYQEKIPAMFKATNPNPWLTVKGWKATADALINSLKAGVGTAKIAYSAAPIGASLGFTTKLSAAQAANLEQKLEAVKLAAAAFGCSEFGTALLSRDTPEQLTNIVMKGASCISSLTEKDRFRKFFDGASVVDSVQNGKHAIAIIDFINLLVSFGPETPPWTALSGLLDVTSAVINSQVIAAEYNADSTKDMLVLQSAVEAEIKRVLDGQFAWYTKRFINARLEGLFVVNYVVADFVMTPDTPTVGVNVAFEARVSSSKDPITSYTWDFGDGTTEVSEGFTMKPTTSHTYMQAGLHTVKLTVTNGFLAFKTVVEKTITVGEALDENPKDGIPDWWAAQYGVTDANADNDINGGDGLSNLEEYNLGTDPTKRDTDGDDFTDKEEVDAGTSPTDPNIWPFIIDSSADAGKITLTWDNMQDAMQYTVCYATESIDDVNKCNSYANGTWVDATTSGVTVSGLQSGTPYYFRAVVFFNGDKRNQVSNELVFVAEPPTSNLSQIYYSYASRYKPNVYETYIVNENGSLKTKIIENISRLIWSPDGKRAAYYDDGSLYVMNADGSGKTKIPDGIGGSVYWSPDSKKIALLNAGFSGSLYVINTDHFELTENIADGLRHLYDYNGVSWSPDSIRLAFTADDLVRTGIDRVDIYLANADGSDLKNLTINNPPSSKSNAYPVWLNNNKIGFRNEDGVTPGGIFSMINSDGTGDYKVLGGGSVKAWSPDGNKVAYVGNVGAYQEKLYVANVDGSGGGLVMDESIGHGTIASVVWSPDSKKIAVESGGYYGTFMLSILNADWNVKKEVNISAGKYGIGAYRDGMAWSSDSSKLAFVGMDSWPSSSFCGVYVTNLDGSNVLEVDRLDTGYDYLCGGLFWKPQTAVVSPFIVQAADETGTAFTVPAGKTQCTFTATGTWKWDSLSPAVTPDGSGSAYTGFRIPVGNAYDLILQRANNTFEHIGSSQTVNVSGNEALRFMMNDISGVYGDNSGSLSVGWSCQ